MRSIVLEQLYKEILPLQGFKPALNASIPDMGLGPVLKAFPNHVFPLGAVHEFICRGRESAAATSGFICGILKSLMHKGGTAIWIRNKCAIFPPALSLFGINAENIIYVDL